MRISDWSSDVCSSDLQVLVGRDDHAAMAEATRMAQRAADQVIGPVFRVRERRQPERLAQCLAVHELALEILRRRIAVGIVGRIQRLAAKTITEEGRVGKEGVSTGRSRWEPVS